MPALGTMRPSLPRMSARPGNTTMTHMGMTANMTVTTQRSMMMPQTNKAHLMTRLPALAS